MRKNLSNFGIHLWLYLHVGIFEGFFVIVRRIFWHCTWHFPQFGSRFRKNRFDFRENFTTDVSWDEEVPLNFVNRWDPESGFGLWIHIPDPDNIRLDVSPCSPVLLLLSKLMQIISVNKQWFKSNSNICANVVRLCTTKLSFHYTTSVTRRFPFSLSASSTRFFVIIGRVSHLTYVSMRHYVLTTSGDIFVCFHTAPSVFELLIC